MDAAAQRRGDVLRVEGASYRYGAVEALSEVSLTVGAGDCVALLGPNGAGKTTLVNLVTGLLVPAAGTVDVCGGDPRRAATRRSLGVVAQSAGFPRTFRVGELLRSAATRAGAPRGAGDRALASVGAADLAPRRAKNLSGGQQRRVQLAMALVGAPAVLVLDEPTNGLDVGSRHDFWALVAARRDEGVGVLVTTHLMEEAAAVADHVVVLDRARVVVSGTPHQLTAAMPQRTVSAVSALGADEVASLVGTDAVTLEGGRVVVRTAETERVVWRWMQGDPTLSDLAVASATLEQAVAALTGDDAPALAGTTTSDVLLAGARS